MHKAKKESFFWTSYSDLMTSLFFVMLVLFVLALVIVKKSARESNRKLQEANQLLETVLDSVKTSLDSVKVSNEQLTRVLKVDEQFRPLLESGMFKYYPESRKFVAKDLVGKEIFKPNSVEIKREFVEKTIEVGLQLERTLCALTAKSGFKYQLVIEGNMANTYDHRYNKDAEVSYVDSYRRALAVYNLWRKHGINLRKYGVEVLICGSGMNGLDRDPVEENNKRFSIQIIPKISSPK